MPPKVDESRVPADVGLNSPGVSSPAATANSVTLIDARRVLAKRKYLILAVVVIAIAIAFVYAKTRVSLYEAAATAEIDTSRSESLGLSEMMGAGMEGGTTKVQTEVFRMTGDSLIFRAVAELGMDHRGPFPDAFKNAIRPITDDSLPPQQRAAIIRAVHGAMNVSIVAKTNAVRVSYRNPNPVVARDVVNELLTVFMERSVEDRLYITSQAADMLSKQMEDLKNHAADAQGKLAAYQEKHRFIGSDEKDNLTTSALKLINEQLSEAEADQLIKDARLRLVQTGNPELLVSLAPTPTLQALRSQQTSVQLEIGQLSSKYGSGYPKLRELQSQLPGIEKSIQAESDNVRRRIKEEAETSASTAGALRNRLNDQMQQAFKLNEGAAQYALLREDAESSRDLYDVLQLKLKESSVTAALNAASISVIDHAVISNTPVEPNRRRIMTTGGLAGLLIGVFLAFSLEALDDTLQTSEDVEAAGGIHVLGAIPHFDPDASPVQVTEPGGYQIPPRLVTIIAPESLAAESFRGIRSSILLSAVDSDHKIILITSSHMSEGKSTLSVNLAITLALRGARVLLVDTDLRRSTLHKIFNLDQSLTGLSHVLGRFEAENAYLQPVPSLPSLTFLPAGAKVSNPAELLASNRMLEQLAIWRRDYDHVIIDSAPILMVSDALAIAARADGVVFVVRANLTRKKAFIRAVELLKRSRANILGAVVNDVDLKLENFYTYSSKGYGYGYSGYKGYGTAYGDDKKDS